MERGIFKNLAENYDKGRRDYPQSVIDYFNELSGDQAGAYVLDMGSGTGIATRQIAASTRFVVGCEPSLEMVQIARKNERSGIAYSIGRAEQIPFVDNSFDTMTVFSAFHWMMLYHKERSMQEIQRVLKPSGLLFVVGKKDLGTFSEDAYRIIRKHSSHPPSNDTIQPDTQNLLINSGFKNVNSKVFTSVEQFSPEEALAQIQSMDDWNFVDEEKVLEINVDLNNNFNSKIQNGIINREVMLTVISGYNQK